MKDPASSAKLSPRNSSVSSDMQSVRDDKGCKPTLYAQRGAVRRRADSEDEIFQVPHVYVPQNICENLRSGEEGRSKRTNGRP